MAPNLPFCVVEVKNPIQVENDCSARARVSRNISGAEGRNRGVGFMLAWPFNEASTTGNWGPPGLRLG